MQHTYNTTTISYNLFNRAVESVVDVQALRHSPDRVMATALSEHSVLVGVLVDQVNDKGWQIVSVDTRWFNILDMIQNPDGATARLRTVVTAREK